MTSPKSPVLNIQRDLDFTGLRFKQRTETKGLTVHCTATPPRLNWGAVEVDRMHRQNDWLCIGYHFVIDRDGVIHAGRPLDAQGSHCRNGDRNETHIGIALTGGVDQKGKSKMNFTKPQFASLDTLIMYLSDAYGLDAGDIEGHRDVKGVRKDCPCFNVATYITTGKAVFR